MRVYASCSWTSGTAARSRADSPIEPGWRTPHNSGITELHPGHGHWRTTWRHEHDSHASRELALDCRSSHRRGGRRGAAGCGSTGHASGAETNARSGSNSALQFSQCMRANGVPNFPDPGPRGYQITPAAASTPSRRPSRAHSTRAKSTCPRPDARQQYRRASGSRNSVRAVHARERRPQLPRPRCERQYPVPRRSPIPQSSAFQRAQNGPCKKYDRPRRRPNARPAAVSAHSAITERGPLRA